MCYFGSRGDEYNFVTFYHMYTLSIIAWLLHILFSALCQLTYVNKGNLISHTKGIATLATQNILLNFRLMKRHVITTLLVFGIKYYQAANTKCGTYATVLLTSSMGIRKNNRRERIMVICICFSIHLFKMFCWFKNIRISVRYRQRIVFKPYGRRKVDVLFRNWHIVERIISTTCNKDVSKYTSLLTYPGLLWIQVGHGPLTRYVKLQVAHAPGMPGKFSIAAVFKGIR